MTCKNPGLLISEQNFVGQCSLKPVSDKVWSAPKTQDMWLGLSIWQHMQQDKTDLWIVCPTWKSGLNCHNSKMTHSPALQLDKHLVSSSALSLSHAICNAAALRAIDNLQHCSCEGHWQFAMLQLWGPLTRQRLVWNWCRQLETLFVCILRIRFM